MSIDVDVISVPHTDQRACFRCMYIIGGASRRAAAALLCCSTCARRIRSGGSFRLLEHDVLDNGDDEVRSAQCRFAFC